MTSLTALPSKLWRNPASHSSRRSISVPRGRAAFSPERAFWLNESVSLISIQNFIQVEPDRAAENVFLRVLSFAAEPNESILRLSSNPEHLSAMSAPPQPVMFITISVKFSFSTSTVVSAPDSRAIRSHFASFERPVTITIPVCPDILERKSLNR